jgi:hypothetical protein
MSMDATFIPLAAASASNMKEKRDQKGDLIERLPAHNFPEQDRYVDTKDLFRLKVALRMVGGRVTVSKVVKPVVVGPLGLSNGRTARAGLVRRVGLLRVRFPKAADRRLFTTFPLKEGLEKEAINPPLGLGLLRGEVFLLILKTSMSAAMGCR